MPDYKQYGALPLAYMGDCVYEIAIRKHLMQRGNMPVNKLHTLAKYYVSAPAQSNLMSILEPVFTQEELAVYKRGRNAKSFTTPKNATISDYKKATGMEAVFGFLYLTDKTDRINQLMDIIFDFSDNPQNVEKNEGDI